MKLQQKVAIVTGAGAGMGRAVAIRYAQEGASVILGELNESAGNETLRIIQSNGGEAALVTADVSKEEDAQRLAKEAVRRYGRIDVLYNNVARMHARDARVHELSSEVWHELVGVNLNSAFFCAKHVITEMLITGGGSMIFVGSPTALIACAPADAGYSSTKSGVHALARVIAGGYGKDKIRANIIIPGTMETPMTAAIVADEKRKHELEESAMLGRLGQADDITGLAVFLASDESSYCTGAYFTADGGLTAF